MLTETRLPNLLKRPRCPIKTVKTLIRLEGWVFAGSRCLFYHALSHVRTPHNTVNSEIFARTLFSRNFAYAKFRENKTLAKWQNHSVVY